MSTIKVDTIATRTGSGAITVSNNIALATEGQIDINSTNLLVRSTGNKSGLRFDTSSYTPFKNGSAADGTVDLGFASGKYKDLYLGGGLFVGGTGAANKLDDYEEGTFTPNIGGSGVAYGTQTGVYRKIGKLVYVYLQISINTIGSPATTSGILGLPFAPAISNQYFGITYATGLNSNYYEMHGNFRSNSEIRTDGKTGIGSGQNSGLSWAKTGAAIYGSGCYYTTA